MKAQSPDELAARIARAERGILEDEEEARERLAREQARGED